MVINRSLAVRLLVVWATVFAPALRAQVINARELPSAVRVGYAAKFPGTRKTEWKRKGDGSFEAEFDVRGVGIAAKFDSTGAWLETESDLKRNQVPATVTGAIGRQFAGYEVIERQRLEPRNGPPLYEIHLQNRREVLKVQFDSGGSVIAQSSKPRP
jgi:putative PepSY-like beta-lactamase-inhibitor